ncbi:hypothetical protein chiPu_0023041 [Chiloscyllium punctatum]|uniref:Uncharacterized protein n=1 Tax=Chiloscyllium punctatum TaxID=137246 RepID=A0A401T9C0_CHIPU|nr:hypothetical protein [Chiloscyllium punctatum]
MKPQYRSAESALIALPIVLPESGTKLGALGVPAVVRTGLGNLPELSPNAIASAAHGVSVKWSSLVCKLGSQEGPSEVNPLTLSSGGRERALVQGGGVHWPRRVRLQRVGAPGCLVGLLVQKAAPECRLRMLLVQAGQRGVLGMALLVLDDLSPGCLPTRTDNDEIVGVPWCSMW